MASTKKSSKLSSDSFYNACLILRKLNSNLTSVFFFLICSSRIDWLQNHSKTWTFGYKWQLLPFNWTNFNLTSQECSFVGPLSIFFKDLTFCVELWLLIRKWKKPKNFKILFLHNLLVRFQENLVEMFFEWPSTKTVPAILILLKNRWARRHKEMRTLTKLYNSILIKVLRSQDINGLYW